jgi:uncharacterized damage-inducible protein DinB
VNAQARSKRGATLAARLEGAQDALVALLRTVPDDEWNRMPAPSVWSIAKDAEHVVEAGAYHQWIVRLTIGEKVGSKRPAIERNVLTSPMTRDQAIDAIRRRAAEGLALVRALTDDQLDLPTRPPRARAAVLARTIEDVLIGHYDTHRRDIEEKLTGS